MLKTDVTVCLCVSIYKLAIKDMANLVKKLFLKIEPRKYIKVCTYLNLSGINVVERKNESTYILRSMFLLKIHLKPNKFKCSNYRIMIGVLKLNVKGYLHEVHFRKMITSISYNYTIKHI